MENDKLSKLAASEKHEESTDQIEIKGEDGGAMGLVTRFEFYPNKDFKLLSEGEQKKALKEALIDPFWKHCENIGWWPDERWGADKFYRIELDPEGKYTLISYLHRGIKGQFDHQIKSVAGIVGINND